MSNKKTSIILITCDRPTLALQAVSSLYETTKHLPVELVMVADGNVETVKKIGQYLEDKITDTWTYICDYSEKRRGAIWSWNHGLSLSTGDIIFPSGDDQLFHPNWLDMALKYHNDKLDGYGMVALNDKIWNGNVLGTTLLYDRQFCIDHLGGVSAYPDYNYFYVDNELNERAKRVNKFVWCPESVVEHMHANVGKRPHDYLDTERNAKNFGTSDKRIFDTRKAQGFPNNFEPVIKNEF